MECWSSNKAILSLPPTVGTTIALLVNKGVNVLKRLTSTNRQMNVLTNSAISKTFLALSIFCMSIAIILFGKPLLAPLSLSFILAFVLTPVVRWLERRGVGRIMAVGLIVTLLTCLTLLLGSQLASQLNHLVTQLPQHKHEIEAKLAGFRTDSSSSVGQIIDMSREMLGSIDVNNPVVEPTDVQKVRIVEGNSTMPWLTSVPSIILPIVEPIASAVVVIVLVVFMLISREDLRNRFLAVFGNHHLTSVTKIVNETSSRLSNYLLGLVSINFVFAFGFGMVLYFLGVPYAAVWGAVTFVFRFVPVLGSFVSMLLPLSVSLLFLPGWFVPLTVVGVYLTLEVITCNLVEPLLFGKSVGMNPFALLIAIMFWTWAWGPLGLMMATPLSLMLATLGRHLPYLRSLDFLLGDARALPAHLVYFQRLLANDINEAETLLKSICSKRGLPFVVDKVAIRSMSHADRERKSNEITSELHRQVSQRNDCLIWKLMDAANTEAPLTNAQVEPEESKDGSILQKGPLAFGISLCGNRTDAALRAIEISDPKVKWSLGHSLNAKTSHHIVKGNYSIVLISSLPNNPWELIERFAQRLRKDGFTGWIAVGNWRVRTLPSSLRMRLKEAGVDYASHRLHSVCRIVSYAALSLHESDENLTQSRGAIIDSAGASDAAPSGKSVMHELASVIS